MQEIKFEYDHKWDSVTFAEPAKKIITFEDALQFSTRPIHSDYVLFLTKLQQVYHYIINLGHHFQIHQLD